MSADAKAVYSSSEFPPSNEVADAIRDLNHRHPELYIVDWESESRDPKSPQIVKEIAFGQRDRPKLRIIGPQEGEYIIDSNPEGKPKWIHVLTKQKNREERLKFIEIYASEKRWTDRLMNKLPGNG